MTKKILLLVSFFVVALLGNAQESNDSLQNDTDKREVKIKKAKLQELKTFEKKCKLLSDSLNQIRCSIDTLTNARNALHKEILSLQETRKEQDKEVQSLKSEIEAWKTKRLQADKDLISMASYFIYIPYEQYVIDSIAIPSFEHVESDSLKLRYKDRFNCLKLYQNDLQNINLYLSNHVYGVNSINATRKLNELKKLDAYTRYMGKEELDGTYIQVLLTNIEGQFDKVLNQGNADFTKICEDVKRCLSTIEE